MVRRRGSEEPLLPRNFYAAAEIDRNNSQESLESTLTTTASPSLTLPQASSDDESNGINVNRNIKFNLLYTGLAFAGRSIWNQSVLATYVYLITNSNPEAVGLITAVMGMAQLMASIPTGYVADKHRRDSMLKLAAAVGVLAIGVTLVALYAVPGSYKVLVLALGTWGLFWGIANTALGALFADSVPDGYRAYYFTKRSILINLGNTVGPSLGLIMFFVLGDKWTVKDCAIVMTLGQAVCLPAVLTLAFFNDDDSEQSRISIGSLQSQTTSSTITISEPLLQGYDDVVDHDGDAPSIDEVVESQREDATGQRSCCSLGGTQQSAPESCEYQYWCIPKHRLAPVLISIADLTSGLASGMSIRYFPIFFLDTLHLSPVEVQVLYILAPLLQAFFMKTGQHFSQRWGRCQVTILHKWGGIACMTLLVVFSRFGFPSWMICVVYVLRTGLMNSTTPLTKSILMDSVPTHERGRWSALESVNMFSWSGSAAIGGILVSFDGLLFNFSVTATMQFLATIPVIALMMAIKVDGPGLNSGVHSASRGAANHDGRCEQSTSSVGEENNTRSNS